jgi:hypothetical protein
MGKIVEILFSHTLPEYEFTLAHLYSRIWSSLQVVNKIWFKHTKGFELKFEFKPRYTVDYIIEVL